MKKVHIACYICDNEFFFLSESGQVFHETFKSINNEEIVNSQLFKEELEKFLRKNHIKMSLFGKKITYIKNSNLSILSQEKYLEILSEYFRKIEYKNIEDLFKINNEKGVLLLTNTYFDYYFMKKNQKEYLRIPLNLFNGNKTKVLQHIFSILYKPKKLLILGPLEDLNLVAEEIHSRFNIQTTFPEIYYTYLFEEYKKQ